MRSSIACAPSNPDILHHGTSMRAMKSGGDDWQKCYTIARPDGTRQTNGAATTCIGRQIAVEPDNSKRIYEGYADTGLLVTDNGAASWQQIETNSGFKTTHDLLRLVGFSQQADRPELSCWSFHANILEPTDASGRLAASEHLHLAVRGSQIQRDRLDDLVPFPVGVLHLGGASVDAPV